LELAELLASAAEFSGITSNIFLATTLNISHKKESIMSYSRLSENVRDIDAGCFSLF